MHDIFWILRHLILFTIRNEVAGALSPLELESPIVLAPVDEFWNLSRFSDVSHSHTILYSFSSVTVKPNFIFRRRRSRNLNPFRRTKHEVRAIPVGVS
jgi:hypothetical protein